MNRIAPYEYSPEESFPFFGAWFFYQLFQKAAKTRYISLFKMISKLYDSVQSALLSASCYSNNVFLPDGYWWGECITNATPTAEYVFLHQAFGLDIEPEKDAICKYLLSEQRADGSWATAFGNPGNVACTVEAYLALKILGIPADSGEMCRARDFVISHGGIASTSMFTRVVLAG